MGLREFITDYRTAMNSNERSYARAMIEAGSLNLVGLVALAAYGFSRGAIISGPETFLINALAYSTQPLALIAMDKLDRTQARLSEETKLSGALA